MHHYGGINRYRMLRFALAPPAETHHALVMESCCARARRVLVTPLMVSLIAVGTGCNESGQTGSPADVPPTYDSFTNFGADSGGVEPDGNMSGPCFDSNNPARTGSPNDLVQVVGNHLLVMVDQELLPPSHGVPQPALSRGLLVFDVAASEQPELVGELELDGQPLALEVEDGVATVVLRQANEVQSGQIPSDRVAYDQVRLVRVDWSDPAAPVRVADTALSGDFWSLQTIGDRHYVLSTRWEPTEPVCVQGGGLVYTGENCPVGSLQVSAYSFDGTSFVQDVQQDIGGDGYTGFVGPGSFVAVDRNRELDEALTVAWVDPDDGMLRVSAEATVDGAVAAAAFDAGVLAVRLASGPGGFRTYQVSEGEPPTELGRADVMSETERMSFIPGGGGLLLEGASLGEPGPSYMVDLTDPTAPVLTPLAGALEATWLGDSVLGLGEGETGRVVATLWDATDLGAPVQTDQLEANVPYTSGDYWQQPPWTVHADTGRVLYPSGAWTATGDPVNRLLALEAQSATLAVLAEPQTLTSSPRPILHGDTAYSVGDGALEIIPLTSGAAAQTIDLYPDRERHVLSEKAVGSRVARLMREGEEVVVEVDDGGGEPSRFVLEHFAEELYVEGDWVVALGLRRNSDCDLLAEMPDAADLISECPTPNQAGITVISASGEPQVEASILISSDLDAPDLPADADAVSEWCGFLALGDDRLLMPVSQVIRCESAEACEELGIRAYESVAAPGCEGGDTDCSSQPSEIVTQSGSEWHKWIYVLDLDAEDGPELLPGVRLQDDAAGGHDRFDLTCEGPLDLSAEVLVSGSNLGFQSTEYLYDENGNSINNERGDNLVRQWLHLVSVPPDTPAEWVQSVNIPGFAIALRDQGNTVFSVAPEYVDDTRIRAVLRRLEIRDGGAYVDETLSLGEGYRDGIAIGGRGTFIRGPEDPCAEDPTTEVFSVRLGGGDLSAGPALELPGGNWSFARVDWPWDAGTVLLRGGPADYRGRLSLDVSDSGAAPTIIRYTTDFE